jgi:hypothetical protein
MNLKCSAKCEESKEQPLFNVLLVVGNDGVVEEDITIIPAENFCCAFCSANAVEAEE